MAKAKNQPKKLSRFNFSKTQMIVAAVFILGFGGFGVYKLAFSGAYTPSIDSNCKTHQISRGNKGKCVEAAQAILAWNGFGNKYGADGIYGKLTKANVESFQKANKLKKDGVIGTGQTWPALCNSTTRAKNQALARHTGEAQTPLTKSKLTIIDAYALACNAPQSSESVKNNAAANPKPIATRGDCKVGSFQFKSQTKAKCSQLQGVWTSY